MKNMLIAAFLLAVIENCTAENYRCEDQNGTPIYQNWPCGTKPEIEKKAKKKPDYEKIVDCGLRSGLENTARAAVGKAPIPTNCSQ